MRRLVFFSMIMGLVGATTACALEVEAPGYASDWTEAPARYEVPSDVLEASVIDLQTGEEIACKVQQAREKRYVHWLRRGNVNEAQRYIIELGAPSNLTTPVMIGGGDMMDYGREGVVADLGIGMWATAFVMEEQGERELLYVCNDRPQGGVYWYHAGEEGVFERGQRIGMGLGYPGLADMNGDGREDLVVWNVWFDDVRANGTSKAHPLPNELAPGEGIKGYLLRQVDWDGDGVLDLLTAGVDSEDYKQGGFDKKGYWTGGPNHGYLWFFRNTGTNQEPVYAEREQLTANYRPIDIDGTPIPLVEDWDGDGDLDLICGEFLDRFTYFENIGTRTEPFLDRPRPVMTAAGPLRIHLSMMSPTVADWNEDGLLDLIVGQEDGRVSVCLQEGLVQGAPQFMPEVFLQERNPEMKSRGLSRPWMDEATRNIISGETGGQLLWFPWRDGAYGDAIPLKVGEQVFRIQAGRNGSIQGPNEAKWGYTVPMLGDIDNDGVQEIVYNNSFGRIEYVELPDEEGGTTPPKAVKVDWEGPAQYPEWNWWQPEGGELVVQWRSRPQAIDYDEDGICDLVAQDHEGYLALYRGKGETFEPGRRVFKDAEGQPLRLSEYVAGKSGRTKLQLVDWDGDGDLDLIRDSRSDWGDKADPGLGELGSLHVGVFENVGDAQYVWRGDFAGMDLGGHSNAAQAIDWSGDGQLDLIVGSEDGRFYAFHRAMLEEPERVEARKVSE